MGGFSNISTDLARRALGTFLKLVAVGVGVTLRFGRSPCTDGKTVWLPHLPMKADAELIMIAVGDLLHEAAHVLFTDFFVATARVKAVQRGRPLYKMILNAVEDPRIEKKMSDAFSGARHRLHESVILSADRGLIRKPDTAADALTMMICLHGDIFLNQAFGWYVKAYEEAVDAVDGFYGQPFRGRLENLLTGFHGLRNTSDACDLAEEIHKLVVDAADGESEAQQAPQEGEGGGDESESTQPGADDDAPQPSKDSKPPDSSESSEPSSGEPGDGSDAAGETEGNEKSAQGGTDAPAGDQGDQDVSDDSAATTTGNPGAIAALETDGSNAGSPVADVSGLLETLAEEAVREAESQYEATTADPAEVLWQDMKVREGAGHAMRTATSAETSKLRNTLMALLVRARSQYLRPANSGRLRPNRLGMAQVGTSPFGRKTESRVKETAVMILGDLSSSMDGYSAKVASEATLAITEAADSGRIPVAVTAFAGAVMYKVKDWTARMQDCSDRIASMQINVGGGTPLGSAMEAAYFEIVRRPEARKLLIVVTDGAAGDHQYAQSVIEGISEEVECIGIGIAGHSCADLFATSIDVPDISALSGALMEILRTRLIAA